MAEFKMMRKITIGVALMMLSVHVGGASTLATSNDALDGGLTDDPRVSVSPAATAVPEASATTVRVVATPAAPALERRPIANPLWAIPLTQLPVTRERPIFSPSRRPPPAAVAVEPAVVKAPPARKTEPESPQLALVGTIASDEEGFGIFLDQSTKTAIRLKVGEDYQGWKLRAIQGREVTMEKDQQAAVLALPTPGGQSGEVRLLPATAVKMPRATRR
jgi:general secretion pathway protein N